MKNISPKQEPVAWATIVGLAIAALASYGIGFTDEAREFLVVVVPMIIAAIVARQAVTPVETAEDNARGAYQAGRNIAARGDAPGRGGDG